MTSKRMKMMSGMGIGLAVLLSSTSCAGETPKAPTSDAGDAFPFVSEEIVYSADYIGYETLGEAANESEVVVTGTSLSSKSELLYPNVSDSQDPLVNPQAGLSEEELKKYREEFALPITVTQFRVDEVISGDVKPGDVIEIQQDGGKIGTVVYKEASTTLVSEIDKSEGRTLLSLSDLSGRYTPINPTQGVLATDGTNIKRFDDEKSKESMKELKAAAKKAKKAKKDFLD